MDAVRAVDVRVTAGQEHRRVARGPPVAERRARPDPRGRTPRPRRSRRRRRRRTAPRRSDPARPRAGYASGPRASDGIGAARRDSRPAATAERGRAPRPSPRGSPSRCATRSPDQGFRRPRRVCESPTFAPRAAAARSRRSGPSGCTCRSPRKTMCGTSAMPPKYLGERRAERVDDTLLVGALETRMERERHRARAAVLADRAASPRRIRSARACTTGGGSTAGTARLRRPHRRAAPSPRRDRPPPAA